MSEQPSLHERVAEAIAAKWREHRITRHPDACECAVCGDLGAGSSGLDRHAQRIAADAALAAVSAHITEGLDEARKWASRSAFTKSEAIDVALRELGLLPSPEQEQ